MLLPQLSVAVCIGFLTAWSPYAVVAMWATFVNSDVIPPFAFAMAAIFAKSSTIYNPVVYLLFKPNFRKSLSRDTAQIRHKLCSSTGKSSPHVGLKDPDKPALQRNNKDMSNSTRLSNGLPESHVACLHCAGTGNSAGGGAGVNTRCHLTAPQRTARVLTDFGHSEVMVCQLPDKTHDHFL